MNANGTKEQLVDKILDWKMPKDSDDDSDDSDGRSPRGRLSFDGEDSDEDSDEGISYKSVKAKYKQ